MPPQSDSLREASRRRIIIRRPLREDSFAPNHGAGGSRCNISLTGSGSPPTTILFRSQNSVTCIGPIVNCRLLTVVAVNSRRCMQPFRLRISILYYDSVQHSAKDSKCELAPSPVRIPSCLFIELSGRAQILSCTRGRGPGRLSRQNIANSAEMIKRGKKKAQSIWLGERLGTLSEVSCLGSPLIRV